jgi:hypothetical protein
MNLISRIKQSSRELLLFATAALILGMAFSIVDATFNNFLNDRFALSGFERSFLEFPRELPGFLVVFVSAALWFLCSRRLGVVTDSQRGWPALISLPPPRADGRWLFIYSRATTSTCQSPPPSAWNSARGRTVAARTTQRHPQLCRRHGKLQRGVGVQVSRLHLPAPSPLPPCCWLWLLSCCR